MIKGDIVLIPFPFTDLTGNKLRPALILVDNTTDITACFITTQTKWKENTDIDLLPSFQNGIKKPSVIRLNKIATLDKALIIGRLGSLETADMELLNKNLKILLQL